MTRQNPRKSIRTRRGTSRGGVAAPVELRIIGGRFRGRKLRSGDQPRVRPMKDRVRQAVFNLIGTEVEGKHAVDLFAGSGVLALEAISRGAAGATLVEQHFPTAAIIRQNAAALGVGQLVEVVPGDVFRWWKRRPDLPERPWLVFCSPPWDFFVARTDPMLELIRGMIQAAPAGSVFSVEADGRFDFGLLPDPAAWDVRRYLPAAVGIYRR